MKLEDLGYDHFFEAHRETSAFRAMMSPASPRNIRGLHHQDPTVECLAEVTGKLIHTALTREDYPAVGIGSP